MKVLCICYSKGEMHKKNSTKYSVKTKLFLGENGPKGCKEKKLCFMLFYLPKVWNKKVWKKIEESKNVRQWR